MRRRLERHGLWHGDRSELDVFTRVQARGADQTAARNALVRDGGRARRASFSRLASAPSSLHPAAHGAVVDAAKLDEASARLERVARSAASELPTACARAGLRVVRQEAGPPPPRPSSACVASHAARTAAVAAADTSASSAARQPSSTCAPSWRSSSVPMLTQPAGSPAAAAMAPADKAGERVTPSEKGNPVEWASRREVQRLKAALRLASGASLTHGAAARLEAAERNDANVAAASERHVVQQKLAVQQRATANRAMFAVKDRPVVVGSDSSESLLRSLLATLSAVGWDGDAGVPHPQKAEAKGAEPEPEVSIRDAPPSVATTVFQ